MRIQGILVVAATLLIPSSVAVGQATIPWVGEVEKDLRKLLPDGEYPMEFSLWTAPEGGELLWEEWRETVAVRSGTYSVELGEVVPLELDSEEGWLEVRVAGMPLGPRLSVTGKSLSLSATSLKWTGTSGPVKSLLIFPSDDTLVLQAPSPDGAIHFQRSGGGFFVTFNRKLHLYGGEDAEPGSGGYLVMGLEDGVNLALDNNEIQARSNGSVAPLYLNHDGGAVYVGTTLIGSSDAELKEEIRDLDEGLGELLRLRPVSFAWKSDPGERRFGLVGQEVRRVVEEIVYEDDEGTLGISYQSLIPLLIRAVQQQQAEIGALQAQVEPLRRQISALEAAATRPVEPDRPQPDDDRRCRYSAVPGHLPR